VTACQHLVIGSGAGGALTAAMLARAGQDVTVVEEGRWVSRTEVAPFSLSQFAAQYRSGGLSATLGRPPIAYAEGCCAGGSTEINVGLYHLASEETLARWRTSHRVDGLDSDTLAPHARDIESALSIQRLADPYFPASRVLADGAQALGWPAMEVPRAYDYSGAEPVKQSMTETYLPAAIASGARVQCETRVRRLVMRGSRALGAVTTRGAIDAEHVWVCAGAIGTAALLRRSGVKRNVGATLRLHPMVKAAARFEDATNPGFEVPVHQVKPSGTEMSFGGSASRPGLIALALADNWRANRQVADEWPQMALYYASARPEGCGRIIPLPRFSEPVVRFELSRHDVHALAQALGHLARLLFAGGATAVYPSVRAAPALHSPDQVDRLVACVNRTNLSIMTVHLFSTAPMGEDRARCAVDSYGLVHGMSNLRVNDASLLPDGPGVNPQGTVMAIAARNVAAFLADI
jgi:choline dehydrogenase-like flavoprotein